MHIDAMLLKGLIYTAPSGLLHRIIICGALQLDIKQWHAYIDEPTLADAILDRVVHNAYHLDLSGDSLRKLKSIRAKNTKNGGTPTIGSCAIAAPESL